MPTAPFAWTHEKTQVEFDGVALTINGKRLPLDQVERLATFLWRSTAQGSWGRLDCGVHLFADGEVTTARFRGDGSTEQWGHWRPLWDQLDALVLADIQPLLLDRTIRRVTSGSPAEIGSLRAKGRGRFSVTPDGLQARRMFSRPISWKAITDISDDDVIQITAGDAAGKPRTHHTGLGSSEWDAWQIPLLWRHFGAR